MYQPGAGDILHWTTLSPSLSLSTLSDVWSEYWYQEIILSVFIIVSIVLFVMIDSSGEFYQTTDRENLIIVLEDH